MDDDYACAMLVYFSLQGASLAFLPRWWKLAAAPALWLVPQIVDERLRPSYMSGPLPEVKSQPREVPVLNDADQTSTVSSKTVSAVPDSVGQVTAKSAFDDHEWIQGTWDFVTLTTGPRDSIVFAQDTITFHVRDQTVAGTFVLDGSTQPKSIDLLFAGEPGGAGSRQGIYQFQQDLLVICLGTTAGFRPTEFQKGEMQNHILLVRSTADSSGNDGQTLPRPATPKQGVAQ